MYHDMFSELILLDTFPKSPNDIIVAIDFGTSRTGVAWGFRGKIPTEDIEIQPLQGAGFLTEQDRKSPTAILIKSQHNNKLVAFGQKARDKSGKKNYKEDYLFRCFKMNLHEPFRIDPEIESVNKKKTLPLSIVIQKSLEFIKKKVLDSLSNQNILTSKDPYKLTWVLTVPAIWTDVAKYIMRKAAFEAGMIRPESSNRLIIALEPECAFLGAMKTFRNDEFICDKGKICIIVDCGGGTIDITGYEIQTKDPLVVREVIIPRGGHLGSTLIDQKFFEFIKKFVGQPKYEEIEKSKNFQIIELEKIWEESKLSFSFNEEDDDETLINLSCILSDHSEEYIELLVNNWNRNNRNLLITYDQRYNICLSFDLMMSFFKLPIENVVEKVKQVLLDNRTVLKKLDYIIMAGGFCRNIHLIKRMNEEFSTKQGIEVIIGKEPDLLIVKGAAMFGCDPSAIIKTRKAKYTFGVCYSPEYDPTNIRHTRYYDKAFIGDDGITRLDAIIIHGRIGDDIKVGETLEKEELVPITVTQNKMNVDVYISTQYNPFHISEDGNRCLAELHLDLDMNMPYRNRGVQVEFSFGDTEVYCNVYNRSGKYLRRILLDYSKFFS